MKILQLVGNPPAGRQEGPASLQLIRCVPKPDSLWSFWIPGFAGMT
ncbi:MAG: hypothetical protein RDV41_06220 [Planctomycetota bacterium]|nr:hypothetical protein [Planctomycetota bacterium]